MTDGIGSQQQQPYNGQDWYEVQLEGRIQPRWFSDLEGWQLTPLADGNTLLAGPVIDQPALHGLFALIRDLNLKMISLQKISRPPNVNG